MSEEQGDYKPVVESVRKKRIRPFLILHVWQDHEGESLCRVDVNGDPIGTTREARDWLKAHAEKFDDGDRFLIVQVGADITLSVEKTTVVSLK